MSNCGQNGLTAEEKRRFSSMRQSGLTASDTLRYSKMRALAAYKIDNPTRLDMGNRGGSANVLLLREVGELITDCGCTRCVPVCDVFGDPFPLDEPQPTAFWYPYTPADIPSVEEFLFESGGIVITIPPPPPGYDPERYAFLVLHTTVCNATAYTSGLSDVSGTVSVTRYNLGLFDTNFPPNQVGVIILYPSRDYVDPYVSFTASNACSSKTVDSIPGGCFVAGALVTMADGSTKVIEEVRVGDVVRGAFGELNTVLALHRPVLGLGRMIQINGDHKTTAHHPHVAANKTFLAVDATTVPERFYGKSHKVIDATGAHVFRPMAGLAEGRVLPMSVGAVLQTTSGPRAVTTIEPVKMSPFTQLYHLVVGGSHTFCVDGYAVAAWADETDFNYDTWTSR